MGTYIYAITGADHPLDLDALSGVGQPAAPLRTVGTGALSAVISDAPEDLRAKRRDLAAHQAVLERLMADGAVLPMRFGLVGSDDGEVASALEDNRDAYAERLEQIAGCVEYNLKVSREEDDLLREIVQDSEEVRQLREVTLAEPGAQEEKLRLGELVAEEVRRRQDREADELVRRLGEGAVDRSVGDPAASDLLNASFLVRRDDAPSFAQSVQQEADRRGEAYALNLNGPLPPYSFV